jgi:hypothetical protein
MEKLTKSNNASRAPSIIGDNVHSRNDSNNQQSLTLTRAINTNNSHNNPSITNSHNYPSSVATNTPPQSLQPPLESQQENGSGGRGGGEEYEILCNEVVLPLTMTLAAVRQFVWKQSSELVMHYRRKRV